MSNLVFDDNIYSAVDECTFTSLKMLLFRIFLFITDFLRKTEVFFLGGESCLGCGKKSGILPVCKSCAEKLVYKKESLKCCVCGKELVSENGICSSCRNERILFEVECVFPAAPYSLWRKNLLFAWKIQEKRALSPFFARLAFQKILEASPDKNKPLPVVPVPPRPKKIKKQGWDQVDELCFYLKNLYGIRVLPLLKRLSAYQQKKLNRQKRMDGARNAFALEKERVLKRYCASSIEQVILVDDVMTTGSTLEACACVLKQLGIKKVLAVTLFVVD